MTQLSQPSFEPASQRETLKEHALPRRELLPDTRDSITHKFSIDGHEGYITVGLFEDGRPGELFIKMAKEGSTMSGLMDTIGILTSLALQYGVPVEALTRKFEHMRFEPAGVTKNDRIRTAQSVVDYIFRWMGLAFSEVYRASQPDFDQTSLPQLDGEP
jgi:ribonucleoside-diphosphate reductase alpha chain